VLCCQRSGWLAPLGLENRISHASTTIGHLGHFVSRTSTGLLDGLCAHLSSRYARGQSTTS